MMVVTRLTKMGSVGRRTATLQTQYLLTSQHVGPPQTLLRFLEKSRFVFLIVESWVSSHQMAFLFFNSERSGKDWGKELPQLKVKTLEELVQGRAGILNVIRDINLPVSVAGELPCSSLHQDQVQLLSIYSSIKSEWLKQLRKFVTVI